MEDVHFSESPLSEVRLYTYLGVIVQGSWDQHVGYCFWGQHRRSVSRSMYELVDAESDQVSTRSE